VKDEKAAAKAGSDIRKALEMALHVETLAEGIYLELGRLFPEASTLFERLTAEEARHAVIMTINMGFQALNSLPPEFAIDLMPLIEKTLSIGEMLEKKIAEKDITLAEALELAILFEETGAEAYFQETMRSESTDNALNYVKKFFQDSVHHAELIRNFRESLEVDRAGVQPTAAEDQSKLNCWEFKMCGRQPGGIHEGDCGSCPVTSEKGLDGVHGGIAAGRACWAVAGTMCRGKVQGTFAREIEQCEECDFYQKIRREENSSFLSSEELLSKAKK
jgi:rubrerythrin